MTNNPTHPSGERKPLWLKVFLFVTFPIWFLAIAVGGFISLMLLAAKEIWNMAEEL
jgi:hypothetical protein